MAGPTASGKTGLAIELAEELGGEIVGADSRQVYRGLDVGTAKPTAAERSRVPHHLVDIIEVHESYSAGRFARDAEEVIGIIEGAGRTPLVCGGTGFYLEALLNPMFDEPRAAPGEKRKVRAELEEIAGREGREELHRRLAEVDPASAARLHPNDFQRVSRALEVYLLSGRTMSELHATAEEHASYAPFIVLLDPPREAHADAIRVRTEQMLGGGWIGEVERLLEAGVDEDAPGLQSLGYDEVIALVRGRIGRDEALKNIVSKTRRYARRQRTWFKRMDAAIAGDLRELDRRIILRAWRDHADKYQEGMG